LLILIGPVAEWYTLTTGDDAHKVADCP